jgi:hypothetical protein
MRGYGIYDASRGLTLAFAAALVGLGLWGAAQVGTQTGGRFWLSMAVLAAAGFLFALANHVGTWTKGLMLRTSRSTFAIAFLGVLVCVVWILLASQPGNGWEEARIDSWSNSLGILGVVHSLGLWRGVLAFGFGLMLGFSLDGVPAPAAELEPAGTGQADEPVTAERRWSDGPGPATGQPPTPTEETTRTRGRMPAR